MTIKIQKDTVIKGIDVTPVRILGYTDFFYFAGFGNQKPGCFSIDSGIVHMEKCDRFAFEFAGFYNSNYGVPLYYIRRTDGKYLSFQRGSAVYIPRSSGSQARFQQWLVSKAKNEDSSAYYLLLPQVPSEYSYVLKIFDSNTEMGFSLVPKLIPAESQFFLWQVSKKSEAPLPAKVSQ